MEKKSKRGLDVFNERALQPYLDAVYRELGFEFDRVETQELQLQGVDLVIRHQGAEYPIDEKGQTHYINKRLKTFAFELEFRGSKGTVQEGWLFDDKKVTSHYFLVADIRSDDGRVSGLTSFRLVSVHRKHLIAFLEDVSYVLVLQCIPNAISAKIVTQTAAKTQFGCARNALQYESLDASEEWLALSGQHLHKKCSPNASLHTKLS